MKVAINRCFGGFGLSQKAYQWLIDNKGWKVSYEKESVEDKTLYLCNLDSEYWIDLSSNGSRTNLDIIQAIETLGNEADDNHAKIKIVEIPDDISWYISEYDGIEIVHEQHRSWD